MSQKKRLRAENEKLRGELADMRTALAIAGLRVKHRPSESANPAETLKRFANGETLHYSELPRLRKEAAEAMEGFAYLFDSLRALTFNVETHCVELQGKNSPNAIMRGYWMGLAQGKQSVAQALGHIANAVLVRWG